MRGWRARRFNNTTNGMLVLDSVAAADVAGFGDACPVGARRGRILEGYRRRLNALADTCLAWHIVPVFVTQPDQFGYGRDPVTGADLEAFPVEPSVNGAAAVGDAGALQ